MSTLIAQDAINRINHLRDIIRREWAWPSPQGGFGAFILPTFGFPLEEHLPNENRLQRGEAPILAAMGYAFSLNEHVRAEQQLSRGWTEGITKLSQKDVFPLDRESFIFRPVELLGIGLGIHHSPTLPSAINSWFQDILLQAIRQNIFDIPWSFLLSFLTASELAIGVSAGTLPRRPSPDWEPAELALWLWAHERYSIDIDVDEFLRYRTQLLTSFMSTLDLPCDYTSQVVIYSQIMPLMQKAIEQIAMSPQQSQLSAEPRQTSFMRRISHTQEDLRGQIDFGIITVREDENRAVIKRFPINFFYEGVERTYGINLSQTADGSLYSVAIIRCIEQGTAQGQDVARDLIADLNPQWLMLVGISGGVPESEWTLGDVILASRLQDFSVHALLDEGKTEFAQAGGPMHRNIQDFIAGLPMMEEYLGSWNTTANIGSVHPPVSLDESLFYGDDAWRIKVRKSLATHFASENSPRNPVYKVGATASSDALIKDSAAVQQWQQNARQLHNIEMELAGVYHAARRPHREYPILAIRGVSDIIGYKRDAQWTEYACQTAGSFARAVLELRPFTPVEKQSQHLSGLNSGLE